MNFSTKSRILLVVLLFICLPLAALAGGDEQTTADFDWEPVMEAVIQVRAEATRMPEAAIRAERCR